MSFLGRQAEKSGAAKKRLEGLRQVYIGFLDPVTLVAESKLVLNRNNDEYDQSYLVRSVTLCRNVVSRLRTIAFAGRSSGSRPGCANISRERRMRARKPLASWKP